MSNGTDAGRSSGSVRVGDGFCRRAMRCALSGKSDDMATTEPANHVHWKRRVDRCVEAALKFVKHVERDGFTVRIGRHVVWREPGYAEGEWLLGTVGSVGAPDAAYQSVETAVGHALMNAVADRFDQLVEAERWNGMIQRRRKSANARPRSKSSGASTSVGSAR